MKKLFKAVIFLLIFSILFSGCSFSNNIKFRKLETGKNFLSSRDGYYKKLPNNYCIYISLRSKASLFKVPVEYADIEWDSSLCYNNIVLEGHFIKGFFTSNYLALCEEQDNGDLVYLTFGFSNEQVQYHLEIGEICKLLNVDSILWFSLCNTNKEIQRIK